MRYCQFCGGFLECVHRAVSCGGCGDIYGCPSCDRLFQQVTGGIIPTREGETLSPIKGSYKEEKERVRKK